MTHDDCHTLTRPGGQAVTGGSQESPGDGGGGGRAEVTRPVTVAPRAGNQRDVTGGRLRVVGVPDVETETQTKQKVGGGAGWLRHCTLVRFQECPIPTPCNLSSHLLWRTSNHSH